MQTFPTWVSTPEDQSQQELASKRLHYLIYDAALKSVTGGSISAFAEFCDVDRSTIHTFIAKGSFSPRTATRIERACGRDVIRWEHLVYPLEIESEA